VAAEAQKVEIYRAQLQAELSKMEIDKNRVELYRAKLSGVELAFAALRAKPAQTDAPAAPAGAHPLSQPVAIAVGVLMHRNSLARAAAFEMLQSQARDDGLSVEQQAQRLIDAVELLARPARR